MNWGLFLGCNATAGNSIQFAENKKVISVDEGFVHLELVPYIPYTQMQRTMRFRHKDCKPILRPLSSMTDEEKAEMQKLFFNIEGAIDELVFDVDRCVIVRLKKCREFHCNTEELIWLMSKGFYVGQCEKDECIIEESK